MFISYNPATTYDDDEQVQYVVPEWNERYDCTPTGHFFKSKRESKLDLFIIETRQLFVNVYADSQNNIVLSKPYDSKEEAESNILEKDNSVGYTLLRTAVLDI